MPQSNGKRNLSAAKRPLSARAKLSSAELMQPNALHRLPRSPRCQFPIGE